MDELKRILFEKIKHGDEEHQKWLQDKLDLFFASRAPDPAVVALVRAARRAQRHETCTGQRSEDLLAALAPFKHIEEE